jgi:chromosome segregation ATPase
MEQLEAANAMARKNKDAADTAADRLRSAEERIAGLEAYQEQTSRENLTIRKQVQVAVKEIQHLHMERSSAQQQLELSRLDGNALEVQLRTLKHLLEERGINAADVRRSRVLDSPGSRYGTPDLNRVRELERQLEESGKAHEELRSTFEVREQETSREWEEKLQALSNDHQGTIKYIRGLEKVLTKMKTELGKSKAVNTELEKEITQQKFSESSRDIDDETSQGWETERNALRKELSDHQDGMKSTVSRLEAEIATLKASVTAAHSDREQLTKSVAQSRADYDAQLRQLAGQSQVHLEALERENKALEIRAKEAERKVQMFLDQFESSVDNYRRMSRLEQQTRSRPPKGADDESIYSTDMMDEDDADAETEGRITPKGDGKKGDRNSTALDTLTMELDALRSRWENTSGNNYKLADHFEFEKSPGAPIPGHSLSHWAKGLETDDESIQSEESVERLLATPPKSTPTSASSSASKPTPALATASKS